MYDIMELSNKSLEELYVIAENLNIKKAQSHSKDELVYKILDEQAIQGVNKPIQKKKRDRIVNPKLAKVDLPDNNTKAEVPVKAEPQESPAPEAQTNKSEENQEKGRRPRQRMQRQHNESQPVATAAPAAQIPVRISLFLSFFFFSFFAGTRPVWVADAGRVF